MNAETLTYFGFALLLVLLFAYFLRWTNIAFEDERIRNWQKLPPEEQSRVLDGYNDIRTGHNEEHRLFLLGFLRLPDSMRLGGWGGGSDIRRRVELMGYRPWARAMCRAAWKPSGEWKRATRTQTAVVAFLWALAWSVAACLVLRGIYYFSLYTWPYTPLLVLLCAVALGGYWTRKWVS